MFQNFLKPGLPVLLCFTLLIPAGAQPAPAAMDTIYGFDPILFNGRQYIFQIPPGASGNPFLSNSEFQKGWITIADRQYQDLNLNYDVVNQKLLLKYIDAVGYTMVIEISESWLTRFGLGDSEFEFIRLENKNIIYQVIENSNIKVRYYWQKELKLENVMATATYAFSPTASRTSIVVIRGTEYEYKKNRDFVRAFEPAIQLSISKYLKNNKIKVNHASASSMQALVNFCNTLLS